MPVDFRDILAENARKQAEASRFISSDQPRGAVGGALWGLGQLLTGIGTMRKDPQVDEAKLAAKEFEGLEREKMSLGNELTRIQSSQQAEELRKIREGARLKDITRRMLAGEDPLQSLPEAQIAESGVPVREGDDTGLTFPGGEPVRSGRRIQKIRDIFGEKYDALPDQYKPQLIGYLDYPAHPDYVKSVGEMFQEISKYQSYDLRAQAKANTQRDPYVQIDKTRGRMASYIKGMDTYDEKIQRVNFDAYNSLIPQLRSQMMRTGATQEEIEAVQPLSEDFFATPKEARVDWFKRVFGVLGKIGGSQAPDPVSDSSAGAKRSSPPPPVAGATPPVNRARVARFPRRPNESLQQYAARMPDNLTNDEILRNWKEATK